MKIALISCGKAKREGKHEASKLYIGSYFSKTLTYAQNHNDETYILSAKYGLISLKQELESYDLKITQLTKKQRDLWALAVAHQLREVITRQDELYVYAGAAYWNPLALYFPQAHIMFEGLSMGRRMKAMTL